MGGTIVAVIVVRTAVLAILPVMIASATIISVIPAAGLIPETTWSVVSLARLIPLLGVITCAGWLCILLATRWLSCFYDCGRCWRRLDLWGWCLFNDRCFCLFDPAGAGGLDRSSWKGVFEKIDRLLHWSGFYFGFATAALGRFWSDFRSRNFRNSRSLGFRLARATHRSCRRCFGAGFGNFCFGFSHGKRD